MSDFPFVLGKTKIGGKTTDTANTKRDIFSFGTITADQLRTFKKPYAVRITNVYVQGGATFAADDTNYIIAGAINKGTAGSGTGVIIDITNAANSSKATGGTGYTAFVPNSLTVITTSAVNVLAANESVQFTLDINGTVSIADYCLIVDYVDA